MSLLSIVAAIVLVGLLLWAVNRFIPLDGNVRAILNAVVVIALLYWVLKALGVIAWLAGIRI